MITDQSDSARLRAALAAIAEDRVPHPDGYHVRVPPDVQAFAQGALAPRRVASDEDQP